MKIENNFGVGIKGLGVALPERILTNKDLENMVDTSDEWIVKRTGISERRILEKDQPLHSLGIRAALEAIDDAGLTVEDIDLIIVATVTPDYHTPSMACIIQEGIGAKNIPAFDINAACSGFVYGLTVAKQFIQTGYYNNILLLGCEGLSKVVDWTDRNTCVLFGDAAGAAVIGKVEEGYGVVSTYIGSDGSMGRNITIPDCYVSEEDLLIRSEGKERTIRMDGSTVMKFAVRVMASATEYVLDKAKLNIKEIDMIFPHQANIRIIEGAAKRMGIPEEKIYVNVNKYGNVSSASIPVALYEAYKDGKIYKGNNLVLVGFGGGLTWAAAAIKWSK